MENLGWRVISAIEGTLYCIAKNVWCLAVDRTCGTCTKGGCDRKEEGNRREYMYCKASGSYCPYVDYETGCCGAVKGCHLEKIEEIEYSEENEEDI